MRKFFCRQKNRPIEPAKFKAYCFPGNCPHYSVIRNRKRWKKIKSK